MLFDDIKLFKEFLTQPTAALAYGRLSPIKNVDVSVPVPDTLKFLELEILSCGYATEKIILSLILRSVTVVSTNLSSILNAAVAIVSPDAPSD